MAIVQISKIQVRTGDYSDLPVLSEGEFGYAVDSERLFIGNPGATLPIDNTEILTSASPIPASGSNTQVIFNNLGSLDGDSAFTFNALTNNLTLGGDFTPQADATHDLGTSSLRWDNLFVTDISTGASGNAGTITGTWTLTSGSTFEATYSADVAEYYTSDEQYEPGTVLAIGGTKEVTITNSENYKKLAGVVSTSPAYKLNTAIANEGSCIALVGRVPVKVIGKITKGDLLKTSKDHPGVATVEGDGVVLGRALSDYDSNEIGKIEVKIINN